MRQRPTPFKNLQGGLDLDQIEIFSSSVIESDVRIESKATLQDDRRMSALPLRADILRERLHHPAHRRMLPVLHLDPILRPAALIGPVASFRRPVRLELFRVATVFAKG